jgi:hypothetical protein
MNKRQVIATCTLTPFLLVVVLLVRLLTQTNPVAGTVQSRRMYDTATRIVFRGGEPCIRLRVVLWCSSPRVRSHESVIEAVQTPASRESIERRASKRFRVS